MTAEEQTQAAHSMNLCLIAALIKAMSISQPSFPRNVSEALSALRDGMVKQNADAAQLAGMDMAMEWLWKEFTAKAPSN